jgi:PAS domain S-box-containing protein
VTRFVVSLAGLLLAVVLRRLMDPVLGDDMPFITLFPAVGFAAWYGGRGPALAAIVVGGLAVDYLYFEPRHSIAIDDREYQFGLVMYGLLGLALIAMFESLARARDRAFEQSELLRVTLASIGDGVITTDALGYVTDLNSVAEELTGWSSHEARGQPLETIFPIVDEETREAVQNPAQRALELGTVVGLANHTVLITRDGRDRSIDDCAAPIRDDSGSIVGSILVFRDVTSKRQSTRAQEVALSTLKSLVGSAPVGIAILDRDMRFLHVNALLAEMNGVPAEEHVGKTLGEIVPDLRAQVEPIVASLLETGHAPPTQLIEGVTPKDPSAKRTWRESWFPIVGPGDQLMGAGVIVDEITEERRAEREMADLAQRVTSLVDNTPLAVIEWDADFTVRRWAGLAERVFGWTADEVIGKRIEAFPFVYAEDVPMVEDTMARLRDPANRFVVCENRNLTKSGDVVSCEWYNSVLHDENGQMVAVLSLVLDVTERDSAIGERRRAEERFRASQEASLFGFGILSAVRDADARISDFEWEYVNPAAAMLLNRTAAELVGRRVQEVVTDNELKRELVDCYRDVVETGEPHDYELWYRGDGIYCLFRNMTVKLGDGVAVSFADVTEQHLQQERLRRSEARFRQLAEAMPHIVWEADPTGRRVYINHQWSVLTGRSTEAGLSDRWLESVHPEDLSGLRAKWLAALAEGQPYTAEYRLLHEDGGHRWMMVRGVPIQGDDGQVVRWYGSSTDIDAQKRLAEALAEADTRKDEFLATLAHELRNPLAPLRNGLELMKRAGHDPRALESWRDMMGRQLAHLVRLVDDLLDVSRISRGKIEVRKDLVELSVVVQHAVETSRSLIEEHGHQLVVELPPEPIYIDGDVTRLAQVLANLLNNAAKYTEQDGHIWLTATRCGEEVLVSVRDDGIGIASTMLPRIFEIFIQVDQSLEKSQGGLGIGLSLVKALVELHGGRVEAKSEGAGRGAEFVVRLPIAKQVRGAQAATLETPTQATPARPRLRILIVDDNRDGADTLARVLTILGNETCAAYDGEEAVAVAESFRPDVVLLDLGLPKLNGFEACQHLREREWCKDVTIIAVTGWGQEQFRRRCEEAGFDHHVVKPVDPAALMALLTDVLPATGGAEVSGH